MRGQPLPRPRAYRIFYDTSKYTWRGPPLRAILKLVAPHQPLKLSADDMYFMTAAEVVPLLNSAYSPPARWGLLDFMSVACSSPPLLSSSSCSTATLDAQCSLSDLNHDHPRPVFPAGPQPRPSPPSGPCRTSTTTIHAQCSLPDLNREYPRQVFPAGPHVGRYGTKNVQKKVRKNVRQVCYILLANSRVCGRVTGAMPLLTLQVSTSFRQKLQWQQLWQKLQTKVVTTSCFEMSWWGSLEAK